MFDYNRHHITFSSPPLYNTDISSAIDFMQKVMKKRSIVFVISDFLDTKENYMMRLRLISRKHDVIPVQVYDPNEQGMNFYGLTEYLDLETGKTFLSDSIPVRMELPDTGEFSTLKLRTDEPIELPILKFFTRRIRKE